ncbi:MAG: hypothetical protein Q7R87_03120 [Nanoarchaeota archaeon]|nr:hypothetical protein [Nanoarchaeota archaeon]
MNKKIYFWIGIALLLFLFSSYFIKFDIDSGSNYATQDSLLGILIFHNIFVLLFYIAVIIFLISRNIKIR